MCVQEAEQVNQGIDESPASENDAGPNTSSSSSSSRKKQTLGLHCETQMEISDKDSNFTASGGGLPLGTAFPLESISEDGVTERRQGVSPNFVPTLQSGEWSDIGGRCYMEDSHICISDLAKKFGCSLLGHEAVSFYGVFDGHGGKSAAQFVRDHLPRVIVEDADFPLELEKVVTRSFIQTDADGGLPSKLESLEICDCKKLMERRKGWNLQALPSLSSLKYKDYYFDETESFPGEGMLLPPTLTTLHIGFLDGLKSIDYEGLQHLTSLKTLVIWSCYSLEKLVTDEEGGEEGLLPQSLTTLELTSIGNLKSLSPIHRLTSLRSLSISWCNKISDEVTLPSTITFLKFSYARRSR